MIGGLGIAPAARVLHPAAGFAMPDGSVYPSHAIVGDATTALIDAVVPARDALVIPMPAGASAK